MFSRFLHGMKFINTINTARKNLALSIKISLCVKISLCSHYLASTMSGFRTHPVFLKNLTVDFSKGITDDERTWLWKELDYFEDKRLGKEFDAVLERRIKTLRGITDADRVKFVNGNVEPPVEWVNASIEKIRSASRVIPKWITLIRSMKDALRDHRRAKISKRRQECLLSDVVVNLLKEELCMLIIEEDPRDTKLLNMIDQYISKL